MPELPEVHTTVIGLQSVLPKNKIKDIWSNMWSSSILAKNTIKDKKYFAYFKKNTINQEIVNVKRRAKYILINLKNNHTIIIHMKMTGHLMFGKYKINEASNGKDWVWVPVDKKSPLNDKYNRHIRVVFVLNNEKHLVFCDSRKFGTISLEKTDSLNNGKLSHLGPEPLEKNFTFEKFKGRILLRKNKHIKTVLMDQSIISGIGNIYSDEILFRAKINPQKTPSSLKNDELKILYKKIKEVLKKGIDFGGDSMSDYRRIDGTKGKFQDKHLVYLRNKQECKTKNCTGIIEKKKLDGRSAHYCPVCQKY